MQPGNMILIETSYHIFLIIGDSLLLGGFELGYELFGVYFVSDKFIKCRYDEYLILYDRHELLVEIVKMHFKFIC